MDVERGWRVRARRHDDRRRHFRAWRTPISATSRARNRPDKARSRTTTSPRTRRCSTRSRPTRPCSSRRRPSAAVLREAGSSGRSRACVLVGVVALGFGDLLHVTTPRTAATSGPARWTSRPLLRGGPLDAPPVAGSRPRVRVARPPRAAASTTTTTSTSRSTRQRASSPASTRSRRFRSADAGERRGQRDFRSARTRTACRW